MKETFVCVTLSREDFEGRGFDTKNISDEDMQRIADKVGEGLMEYYWDLIDFHGEDNCMPPTPRVTLIQRIKDVVTATDDGCIELHSNGNPPVLGEEDIILYADEITRFAGEDGEETYSYEDADDDELEFIKDLLVSGEYLTPDFEPVTILDEGNDSKALHTFKTEGEVVKWFNDNFAAANDGAAFIGLEDCLAFVASSSYLSLVDEESEYYKLKSRFEELVAKHSGEEINLGEDESDESVLITDKGIYREYGTMGQHFVPLHVFEYDCDDMEFWVSVFEDVEKKAEEEPEKTYEVKLFYHQCVIVKVKAKDEEDAVAQAYAADFEDPEVCEQLGWEQDGTPEVEEI